MRFLSLAPLLGAICNLCLSVFVLRGDRRSRLNQVFFCWGLCIATWNACTYALFRATTEAEALPWASFLQYAVIFIPVLSLHLSLVLAQVSAPRTLAVLYVVHVGLAIMNATGQFIAGVRPVGYAWYSVAGPGFWLYAITFLQCAVSIVILLRRRAVLPPVQRTRLSSLIAAQILIGVLGTNDILPIIGIDKYPLTQVPILPYGSIAAIFYGIIVGYSVLQHQLLDVRVAFSRITAHAVRFLFLLLIGLALQLTLTVLVPGHQFSPVSFTISLVVLMVTALLASLLFPRLVGTVERLERSTHGDRFETADRVRDFIEKMPRYDDSETLLNDFHTQIVQTLGISSYWIILRDEVHQAFTVHRAHPSEAAPLAVLKINSPVFQLFEWEKAEYLAIDPKYSRPGVRNVERLARQQLAPFAAEFCFPLSSQSEPFGLLLTGPKTGGDAYSAADIALLVALVKSLSLVVNQLRLKTQVRQNQELDLLGRMSRGMAHDLNNLLTPVTTLLELASEPGHDTTFHDELLPVALRNVKRMRAYIREALFFSENLRPDVQPDRLDTIVQQAVEVARSSREKPVEIVVETPGETVVEMDDVLMQRLVANLISNAIDASPPGSKIEVRLERLHKRGDATEWVRLRVIDHGEGISKENLSRVLTPYFTTKDRGDTNRGFGFGLAICRKIVNLHRGNLSIASQLKKGTTVQVDLPSRQTTPNDE
jgi:signal transduction histidine kinase